MTFRVPAILQVKLHANTFDKKSDGSYVKTENGTNRFINLPIDLRLTEDISREFTDQPDDCLLYTSPSPRDRTRSRMPSSA